VKHSCSHFVLLLLGLVVLLISCSKSEKNYEGDTLPAKAGDTFTNSIGIDFLPVAPGEFIMGEATREECDTCNAAADETPRHPVTISKSFLIGRFEVTQKQWLAVMDQNPSKFKGPNRPVENVSWQNVRLFIYALNTREKTDKYRLPTEAEWEYAARAGTNEAYYFGDNPNALGKHAWHVINSGGKTRPVGIKDPNPWGVYDIYGNVFEWCQDWYGKGYYAKSPSVDPYGPSSGRAKVRRGGGWSSSPRICRSSDRDSFPPDTPSSNTGFRLLMEK